MRIINALVAGFAHAGIVQDVALPFVGVVALTVLDKNDQSISLLRLTHAAHVATLEGFDNFLVSIILAGMKIGNIHFAPLWYYTIFFWFKLVDFIGIFVIILEYITFSYAIGRLFLMEAV